MKHESLLSSLTAAVLGFVISFGAAGCFVTAFRLNAGSMAALAGVLAAVCLMTGLILLWRRGGGVLTGLIAAAAVCIWKEGNLLPAFAHLVQHLSAIYDRAYGWGILHFAQGEPPADFARIPVLVWSCISGIAAVFTVCRRRGLFTLALVVLLPLSACVVVTDTVPGESYLFCLLAGAALLLLTQSVRRETPAQGIRLTAAMVIPVLLAVMVLFRIAPREGYVNRAAPLRESLMASFQTLPETLDTGLRQMALPQDPDRTVELSTLGSRFPLTTPVMDVTPEETGRLYLRGQDFDVYDGSRWRSSGQRTEVYGGSEAAGQMVHIKTRWILPVIYLPGFPRAAVTLTGGALENSEGSTEYTISAVPSVSGQQTAGQDLSRFLELPEATGLAAAALLEDVLPVGADSREAAQAIARFVSSSAAYDLAAPAMPPAREDFALWFLMEGERGYCVHFATAATVLLRCAGIPARYVTGYMADAQAGRPMTVTEENAHAWAEYYDEARGCWTTLEATPPDLSVPETTAAAERPSQEAPEEPSGSPETLPPRIASQHLAEEETVYLPLWLLPAVLLLLVPPIQRSPRIFLRRRQFRQGSANRQALRRWQEVERLSRLLRECPPEELIGLAQKAKFSQHTITGEELAAFDSYLESCCRRMRKKPMPVRLIYQYIHAAF